MRTTLYIDFEYTLTNLHIPITTLLCASGLGRDSERVDHVPVEDVVGKDRQGLGFPQRHHLGGEYLDHPDC